MAYKYQENLPPAAWKRYEEKLRLAGLDKCPYKIRADEWADNPREWPTLEYHDLYHYLIKTPRIYSPEAMANYRSLEAYRFFASGWVQTIFHYKMPGAVLVKCDVRPSYRVNEEPHHPWVVLKRSGTVVAGHCDCMAGLGETCSHVAATLYKIEAAFRLGYSQAAPTDLPCQWNSCFTKNVPAAPIAKIAFYTEDAKGKLNPEKRKWQPPPPANDAEQNVLLFTLASSGQKSVCLSLFKDFNSPFISEKKAFIVNLPASLTNLYKPCYSVLSQEELTKTCSEIAEKINVTESQRIYVEESTRVQSASSIWFQQRAGRITGSTAHAALHTSIENPSRSLIYKLTTADSQILNVPSINWGKEHEDDAFKLYGYVMTGQSGLVKPKTTVFAPSYHHHDFQVKKCGLLIDPNNVFLGASPDGSVSCTCCGEGVLEIKCPFSIRENGIFEAVQEKTNFFLDENFKVKEEHPYFTQVQMLLHVSNANYCDFVVWTPLDCLITRVDRNEHFMERMVSKLGLFWKHCILPELLTRNICRDKLASKPQINEDQKNSNISYCVCKATTEEGQMVACDHCDKWYHPACVNLKRLPKTKTWYCPDCRKLKRGK